MQLPPASKLQTEIETKWERRTKAFFYEDIKQITEDVQEQGNNQVAYDMRLEKNIRDQRIESGKGLDTSRALAKEKIKK